MKFESHMMDSEAIADRVGYEIALFIGADEATV